MLPLVKTVTIEELQSDPGCLERWLSAGEDVRLMKDGTMFASVVPYRRIVDAPVVSGRMPELPDFMGRMKRIWGERVFTEEEIQEMRDYEDGLID